MERVKAIFIKKPKPKEQVREWQSNLRKEQRAIERQIRDIERTRKVRRPRCRAAGRLREAPGARGSGRGSRADARILSPRRARRDSQSVEKEVRSAAKRGDTKSCKVLAKEMVFAKRTVARLHTNKANLNSVSLQLGEQLATVNAVGHLEKSAGVMEAMSKVMNNAEMAANLQNMTKEMTKAGIIEEMVSDSMADALDDDDLEDETEEEVAKVLADVAGDVLKDLPGMESVANLVQEEAQAQEAQGTPQEEELDGLKQRLAAMRA